MSDAASPLRPDDLSAALDDTMAARPTGFVVAVSGGGDSVCLMHLMAALRSRLAAPITIATVDHGLRAASRTEAEAVVDAATNLGLPARCLAWDGPKPERAIQERARAARYALLTGLCATLGHSHLLTAHTLDDQAETILFRLMRGSGPAGLSGMRPQVARGGVVHARPLLGFPKSRLRATCEAGGWAYVEDPSNRDPRFARARMRRLLPLLAVEGLDAGRLATLAGRLARAETALTSAADALIEAVRLPAEPGMWRVDAGQLAAAPTELALRVLGRVVEEAGRRGPPRLDRLEALAATLLPAAAQGARMTRTLGGALLRLRREGILDVTMEGRRRAPTDPAARPTVHRVETP